VLILDAATGRVVHEFEGWASSVGRLAFSPDGLTLAAATEELRLWNVAGGSLLASFGLETPAVAWNADGSRMAFASRSQEASVLDAADWTILVRVRTPGAARITCLALSPDGSKLAAGRGGDDTVFFDLDRPGDAVVPERDLWVNDLAWLDDGRLLRFSKFGHLFGLGEDRPPPTSERGGMVAAGPFVLFWNDLRISARGPNGQHFAVEGGGPAALRADGSWVRAGDGQLCFYTEDRLQRRVPLPHRMSPQRGLLTADGRFGVAVDANGRLQVFDARTGAVTTTLAPLRGVPVPFLGGPELVLWEEAPEGNTGPLGKLSWWSIDMLRAGNPKPVRELELEDGSNRRGLTPAMSRDGGSCGIGNSVFDVVGGGRVLWSVTKGDHELLPADGGQEALAVLRQRIWPGPIGLGQMLPGLVRYEDGHAAAHVEMPTPRIASYSPGGARLLCLDYSGARFLDAETLEEQKFLQGPWSGVAWVDDGRCCLLSGDHLNLCDSQGEMIASLALPGRAVDLAVDRNGRRAMAVLRDRLVIVRIAVPSGR
jgi:WD40 repeat protein